MWVCLFFVKYSHLQTGFPIKRTHVPAQNKMALKKDQEQFSGDKTHRRQAGCDFHKDGKGLMNLGWWLRQLECIYSYSSPSAGTAVGVRHATTDALSAPPENTVKINLSCKFTDTSFKV